MRHVLALTLLCLMTACGAMTVTSADEDSAAAETDATPSLTETGVTPGGGDDPDAGTSDAGTSGPRDELLRLRALLVGTWVGVAEAPDGWDRPRWSLEISFSADGHYEAACRSTPCAPFYYDSPGPAPGRTWTLDDVRADSDGVGTLTVVFPLGASQPGELARVRYAEGQLSFEFSYGWMGGRVGPIRYALRRLR